MLQAVFMSVVSIALWEGLLNDKQRDVLRQAWHVVDNRIRQAVTDGRQTS